LSELLLRATLFGSSAQEPPMFDGRTILAQLLDYVPRHTFRRIVQRYKGDHRVRRLTCWDQYVAMVFAQLTWRESLRDIEACLEAVSDKLYHSGLRCGPIARSTLADANERRDWRIFADFAQVLIAEARRLYSEEPWALELEQTVYALDASIIDLCLSVFPWARFRSRKAGIKLHTLLDLCGNIPAFVWVTDAKTVDARILDLLLPEPGAIYVLDRGYNDYKRLYQLHRARATFVTRARKNLNFQRLRSRRVDRTSGVICDQVITLALTHSSARYPEPLRRIRYRDPEAGRSFTYLTNDFDLPPATIAALYRQRWQVELFFKWIKQHLRIKAFYGTSLNAVRTQIWIAISVYVLVAIVRKRLGIQRELYPMLQILSLTLFEKLPLAQALSRPSGTAEEPDVRNQLQLFDF
jgi:transposase